jgi:hypothetical protein
MNPCYNQISLDETLGEVVAFHYVGSTPVLKIFTLNVKYLAMNVHARYYSPY